MVITDKGGDQPKPNLLNDVMLDLNSSRLTNRLLTTKTSSMQKVFTLKIMPIFVNKKEREFSKDFQ